MALPPALLAAAAQHPCFSGVFDAGNRIQVHQDPVAGPIEAIDFQCEDCLGFRLGCLASDLPSGMSHSQAAVLVTEHVRTLRGYALSVGGYHTSIGAWLSAVHWAAAGVFALRTDRGGTAGKPALDVLLQAMQKGLVKPTHPAMLDPKNYITREVHLSVVPPPQVTSMAALLASPHVSAVWKTGYCKVTLAELLPLAPPLPGPAASVTATASVATAAVAASPGAAPPAPTPRVPARPVAKVAGQVCSVCGEIVGERWLLTSSYIGCRCG